MGGKVQIGIVAVMCGSLFSTSSMVFGKLVKDSEWPYFSIMVASCVLTCLAFGAISIATKAQLPQVSQIKWVVLHAMFMNFRFVGSVVAVQLSGAPGDVAALMSVNIVFAAFMGHLFLAEKMRLVHVGMVCCSVVGAVLISQPAFIFGEQPGSNIGCALAVFSGFSRAASLVCARKCKDVPVQLLSCVMSICCIPIFALLPVTSLVTEPSLALAFAQPLTVAGLVMAASLMIFGSMTAGTLGAQLCPAAVNATVSQGAGMIFGYLAQTLLFGAVPGWLTLAGASLMLLAVVATAAARAPQPTAEPSPTLAVEADATCVADDDETESLASFVASEFSEVAPHEMPLRRRGQVSKPVPEAIGVAGVVASFAVIAV